MQVDALYRWPECAVPAGTRQHRRHRLGVGALALAFATSMHWLAWLALHATPAADGPMKPEWSQPAQRALIVELIPPQPKPSAPIQSTATVTTSARDRSTAAARSSTSAPPRRSASPRPHPPIDTIPNDETQHVAISPEDSARGVDFRWRPDRDAIDPPRKVWRSSAEAAIAGAPRGETMVSPFARAVSEAARADCRHAYAGAGLLAIPALVIDTVRDSGCKW